MPDDMRGWQTETRTVQCRSCKAVSVFDPARVGIVFGSAIGGFLGIMEQAEVMRLRGPSRVAPTFIPSVLVDVISVTPAIRVNCFSSGVATASDSVRGLAPG